MKYYLVVNLDKTGVYNKIVLAKSPMDASLENARIGSDKGDESEIIDIFELKDGINLIDELLEAE